MLVQAVKGKPWTYRSPDFHTTLSDGDPPYANVGEPEVCENDVDQIKFFVSSPVELRQAPLRTLMSGLLLL